MKHKCMPRATCAGAAVRDITPTDSVFLFGYPHVPRDSTGVHDPLECAALYLESAAGGAALFLANDLIYLGRDTVDQVRNRIAEKTGVPREAILVSATHTHSGPVTTDNFANAADGAVPKADPSYLQWASDRMVDAAVQAFEGAQPAEIGFGVARAENVGTNRHDPLGPSDPEVPVLVARSLATHRAIGCMVVYGMHPTVMHEDSTLISADFPGFTRRILRTGTLPADCPVVYHMGAAGNQSPRHVTRANTFAESERIGGNLARSISNVIGEMTFADAGPIRARSVQLHAELRRFPSLTDAERALANAREAFESLRRSGAARPEVRTAECNVFGAEKDARFAAAAADGRLAAAAAECNPAEIQAIVIGPWRFVAWPAEFFVEYCLELKRLSPNTYVITLANGQMQGYIVTEAAVERGYYEASNALFSHENGPRFVERSLALIASLCES